MIPSSSLIDRRTYSRYFVNLQSLYRKRDVVLYTGITLTLFAMAFFGLFALRPTLTTIATLVKEIKDKKEIEVKLQKKINDLRTAQTNYASVAGSVSYVNQALPSDPSLSDVVYQIEITAQKTQVAIKSINFSSVDLLGETLKTKKASGLHPDLVEVEFELSAIGEFENLKSYLASLEKIRRLMIIDSFIYNQKKIEETQTLTLNLRGRAFYLPKK